MGCYKFFVYVIVLFVLLFFKYYNLAGRTYTLLGYNYLFPIGFLYLTLFSKLPCSVC